MQLTDNIVGYGHPFVKKRYEQIITAMVEDPNARHVYWTSSRTVSTMVYPKEPLQSNWNIYLDLGPSENAFRIPNLLSIPQPKWDNLAESD